jgi:DNA-binding transcriptional ArsR family regulator
LANPVRLRLLGILFRRGELPVSVVAAEAKVSQAVASAYLRALNARGLLAARRQSRWVYYRPAADASVHGAPDLLGALASVFAKNRSPTETVFHLATAFTHPSRVRIAGLLASGPMTTETLAQRTGISRFALARHLAKLVRRGFVRWKTEAWHLACPRSSLAAALLRVAREQ